MPGIVVCNTCTTERETPLVPDDKTMLVDNCPECPDERQDVSYFHVAVHFHTDKGLIFASRVPFHSPSLRTALESGAVSRALSPMWDRLTKTASLIDADDPADAPDCPTDGCTSPEHPDYVPHTGTPPPGTEVQWLSLPDQREGP